MYKICWGRLKPIYKICTSTFIREICMIYTNMYTSHYTILFQYTLSSFLKLLHYLFIIYKLCKFLTCSKVFLFKYTHTLKFYNLSINIQSILYNLNNFLQFVKNQRMSCKPYLIAIFRSVSTFSSRY